MIIFEESTLTPAQAFDMAEILNNDADEMEVGSISKRAKIIAGSIREMWDEILSNPPSDEQLFKTVDKMKELSQKMHSYDNAAWDRYFSK